MAGLPHKVKLAINTKTYQDDEGDDFTVSMSVYDKDDFTGLGMVYYPFFVLLKCSQNTALGITEISIYRLLKV